MEKYKTSGTTSLFSEQFRLDKLIKQGDPLERLDKVLIPILLFFMSEEKKSL